jgi:hypothetical protein
MFKVVLLIYEDLWLSMDDALPMEADRPSLRVDDGPLMVCGHPGANQTCQFPSGKCFSYLLLFNLYKFITCVEIFMIYKM